MALGSKLQNRQTEPVEHVGESLDHCDCRSFTARSVQGSYRRRYICETSFGVVWAKTDWARSGHAWVRINRCATSRSFPGRRTRRTKTPVRVVGMRTVFHPIECMRRDILGALIDRLEVVDDAHRCPPSALVQHTSHWESMIMKDAGPFI